MTALDNIRRALAYHGLQDALVVTQVYADRIHGVPVGSKIYDYCYDNRWPSDPGRSEAWFHGDDSYSFREPGDVHPALQIVFHADTDTVEIDLDIANPWRGDLIGLVVHGAEVLWNFLSGAKTNQRLISQLLDRRFAQA